jgi:membrane-associated protease RseP (regulator of RpoE activity)
MPRRLVVVIAVLALGGSCAWGQSSQTNRKNPGKAKNDLSLGLRFAPIPEVLLVHVPQLPKKYGLLVEQVKSDSPAQRAGLKRNDILLSYNGKDLKSGAQFAALVRADKGTRKVPLVVLRHGKQMTLGVNLARLSKPEEDRPVNTARGYAKGGKPPRLSVEATMLDNGKMKVCFEYRQEGKAKLKKVTYSGSLDEIEAQVRQLPTSIQDLARVALGRLRNRKYK